MLSELRKYRVDGHGASVPLPLISFRLGAEGDGYISRELNERFEFSDLTNLENHRVAVKLMIDG